MFFPVSGIVVNPFVAFGVACVISFFTSMGGVYGIASGSIAAPFLVAIVGLSVHTIARAALMGSFITSAVGLGFYQILPQIHTEMAVAPDFDAPMASMGTMAPFRKSWMRLPCLPVQNPLTFSNDCNIGVSFR
ncbi:MAG: hypothetical protein LJE63_07280 [Desulfobacteraceae bacterium]|jgi:hypothetical protein|nr:hypothetical protein [Desulfobacteraceae bacterium]